MARHILQFVFCLGAVLATVNSASLAQSETSRLGAEPLPKLPEPNVQPPNDLPPEVETDEPAVFQDATENPKAPALKQEMVEEKPALLMEQDKPDFIPLFFAPEKNGVVYGHQEIEYDLTNPLILRIGPLAVTAAGVTMRLSRETGEFFEFEFGLDLKKRYANMYMLSFQWPVDLVPDGVIELFNDEGKVIWHRPASEEAIRDWRQFVAVDPVEPSDSAEGRATDPQIDRKRSGEKLRVGASRLKQTGHDQSSFGLFGREIFEIPVWKIQEPFRFCVTKDAPEGRIALCSKRYRFTRRGGRYWVVAESRNVVPKVMVNDRPVTLKGSAVFIDDKKPIKFAALMGNGTYFEFVSFPKRITIVDMVMNEDSKLVEVIGYGPPPLGPIDRIDRRAKDYWDFLNFLPTIGDFRQFWKASFPPQVGSLYLRGYGGAPFKQPFVFERLPRKSTRPLIHIRSPKSTYARTTTLKGETKSPVKVSSNQLKAESLSPTEFKWEFLATTRGQLNEAEIQIKDGEHTFRAFHDIYKGFPRELSARVTGVLTNSLEVVMLGELAFQWWFEQLLWWDNPRWSHQRWGINSKFFQSLAVVGGSSKSQSLIKLRVGTLDLKYRLTPGIWGRDHTLGVSINAQSVQIEQYQALMGGAGVFWARSMPRLFDNFFNVVPFLRYPKWVDVEGIVYLLPMSPRNQLGVNSALNFHGKILWTDRFFGEAGFGAKLIQFDDLTERKSIGLAIAYGTVGVGYNF